MNSGSQSVVSDPQVTPNVHAQVKQDFIATYLAELVIWPGFQTYNFVKVPVQHQLLAVNCVSLIDATFLSWSRCQEDWWVWEGSDGIDD